MREETPLSQCVGSTLEGAKFSTRIDQLVLTFSGDKFATIEADRGGYEYDVELLEGQLKLFDFGDKQLVKIGVLSDEEMANRRSERDEQRLQEREKQERELFERLKGKFG